MMQLLVVVSDGLNKYSNPDFRHAGVRRHDGKRNCSEFPWSAYQNEYAPVLHAAPSPIPSMSPVYTKGEG
jgi:uncharacterized protein YycO